MHGGTLVSSLPEHVAFVRKLKNHQKRRRYIVLLIVFTQETQVQQDDPDFITSPLAWALHRAADTLEVGTTVVSGGITIGHAVAKLGFSTAKEVTKAVLPSVIPKDAEILPSLVKGTVEVKDTDFIS